LIVLNHIIQASVEPCGAICTHSESKAFRWMDVWLGDGEGKFSPDSTGVLVCFEICLGQFYEVNFQAYYFHISF
jgi:hypothetical protein